MTRAHVILWGVLGLVLAQLVASAPATPQPAATAHYVTATALAGGDGTAGAPWTLATALAHPAAVKPGDTIWVRGGLYEKRHPDIWQPRLAGTQAAPIIVRAVPGERVQVTGTWQIWGSDTWYWGFEHTYLGTESRNSVVVSDQPVRGDIVIYGDRVKLINPIIHDLNAGVGFFGVDKAIDSSVYGAIIFNNGWQDSARGNGNGFYIQSSQGTKWITDCISFNHFAMNGKAFSTNTFVRGVTVEGLIAFNAGAYAVSTPSQGAAVNNFQVSTENNPASGIVVKDSAFYMSPWNVSSNLSIGRGGTSAPLDAKVTGNYLAGGHGLGVGSIAATVTDNVIYGTGLQVAAARVDLATPPPYTWDRNTYFDGVPPWAGDGKRYSFQVAQADRIYSGVGRSNLLGWRETTGYDTNSTYVVGKPAGTKVIVRPNRYEPGRAHIAVYNWGTAPTVSVDVSSVGLAVGDRYEVSDVQNLFGSLPVASGTYTGAPIALPMNLTTVARATGMTWEPRHTAPEFAVFVLRKVKAAEASFLLRIFTDAQGRFLRAEPVPTEPMQ